MFRFDFINNIYKCLCAKIVVHNTVSTPSMTVTYINSQVSKLMPCLLSFKAIQSTLLPGHVAQSVTCLATDACLTADPGVASSIPAQYHTFVEIDHEIISTVILLPSADLFKKDCCQLQAKVCAQITG